MENFTPVSAAIGGTLIGLSAVLFMLLNGRIAGISGLVAGVLTPSEKGNDFWISGAFVVGLFIAPLIVMVTSDRPPINFPQPLWMVVVGGFLVGMGSRLGSGCTSGHGVCGIARLSRRSIIATLTFMISAVITVFFVRHVMGG
ncbi:YeeE/YedE family protein [Hyphococcus lacteus]|uniref:YeeE/YedE family protein n=1 Tax=Hyphococcus lacteus TaxID=3143536 RepID=A0ABV3Z6M5_9PROT